MPYLNYDIADFVADEDFIQWVKYPNEESNAFWSGWLSKNPDRKPLVKEARQVVSMLQFEESKAPDAKFLDIWGSIVKSDSYNGNMEVSYGSYNRDIPQYTRYQYFKTWHKVVASFIMIATIAFYAYITFSDTVTIKTAYGESRTFFLPDSTKVTLNVNSELRYSKSNFNTQSREVWLDGEAFFAVVHKDDNQNFLVNTNELQVEVLGTKFNVNSRRGKSQIVLEEGMVKLDISDGETSSKVVMEPGEMVEYTQKNRNLSKKSVNTGNYSSWRSNQLVFLGKSLDEISQLLEDNYGYKVVFEDNSLRRERFTGSTSVDDLQELFKKLERLFDLDIQHNGKKLTIKRK